jgi:hypothetical protein
MPRYLVERSFPDQFNLPGPGQDPYKRRVFVENNTLDAVTWLHSYVSPDSKKSFCIYDAPSPESLRRAAKRNGLAVDRITEVRVLTPYFFAAAEDVKVSE